MNFQPLFTTSRVVTEMYRIASTVVLFIYLFRRTKSHRSAFGDRYHSDSHRRWHDS